MSEATKLNEESTKLSALEEWLVENEHRCLAPGFADPGDVCKTRALPFDVIPAHLQLDLDRIPDLDVIGAPMLIVDSDGIEGIGVESSNGSFDFRIIRSRQTYEGWKWATQRMAEGDRRPADRWKGRSGSYRQLYLWGYFSALVDTYARSIAMESALTKAFDAVVKEDA